MSDPRSEFELALMVERISVRAAGIKLRLGPEQQGPQEIRNSEVLKSMKKFRKRPQGDLASAVEVAAGMAKQTGKDWYAWQGNSFMHAVWNVTDRESKALVPFSNIGQFVYRVTPGLDIYKHEVLGRLPPPAPLSGVEE